MEQQRPAYWYRQSGVIAYRQNTGDTSENRASPTVEVLLITSRKRKRWIIPKGIVDPGISPQDSAAKEAYEEAGILGKVSDRALGVYTREKWGGTCTVELFPFEVTEVLDGWPERDVRQRAWMSIEEAVARVQEEQLKGLIRTLPEFLS